jgi:DNA polymerase III epsilon subunit-like protein
MESKHIINKKIRELKFVALDLEATYSKPLGRHEIIEIGACKLEPGMLEIGDSYEMLVRPQYPIIPAIKQKTGLTDEIVSKAKPITEIWNEFLAFIENRILLVYKTIDIGILQRTSEAYGLPSINNSFLDIFRLVKRVYPNGPSYALDHFRQFLKIPKISHRAGADAYVTALLFKHLIEILENKYKIFNYKELLNYCYPNKISNDNQGKLF